MWIKRLKPVYKKMGVILFAAGGLSLLIYVLDSTKAPEKNQEGRYILERGSYGSGKKNLELEARIADEEREPLTVTVEPRGYTKEELPKIFSEAGKKLESCILGENESLDEVRHNLKLIEKIPDTGIAVSWDVGNYEVINLMGELQQENLKEEGTLVELRALLTGGDEEAVHTFYAKVFPPETSRQEKQIQKLKQKVQEEEGKSKENKYVVLPSELEGKKVTWNYARDSRAGGLFILGIAASVMILVLDREKKKQAVKERKRQMMLDYPQLISQFTLFLGAGMTVRNTWFKIAQEYEKQKKIKGSRAAYEELVYTMHEIQGGISEGECYERFGGRCALPSYRKFGSLLSQNLKKGTKGLVNELKREAAEAFEDRKNLARRQGEEAGTRLLGPMFMMLAVVLIIIVVPAFFTIQI